MKTLFRWIAVVVAVLVTLVGAAVGGVYALSSQRLAKTYAFEMVDLGVPVDDALVAHGRHVATVRGCVSCHEHDLGGGVMVDEPILGRLVASNLTAGRGGVAGAYTDRDFARAVLHGVAPSGRALVFMPSHEYHHLSDHDVAALTAFWRSVPAVDREFPRTVVGPLLRGIFLVSDDLVLLPAERIDHAGARPAPPAPGATPEYGAYLATTCTGCHGVGFAGGSMPGSPPDSVVPTNLTPAGNLGRWTDRDFVRTMRTGTTPEGHVLDAKAMPWPLFSQMTDEELTATYLYLASLPERTTGTR